ncbi:Gfo/Idh/MocA family protein [Gordonia sp. CPCC 205333]|uniref:Gfo/Idh/MocA family protein n=1 Tax=Gordonia sp. CPCC 205333 TaxID=3140790 RepID=UPI003AF37A58
MVPEYSNPQGRELSVGVIGASGWADVAHLPALTKTPGLRLGAIATSRPESAKHAAKKWGIDRWYTDAAHLASDPEVDLITVSVKAPLHRAVIEQIVAARKPVLCEWPMGVSTSEAIQLAELFGENNITAFVGLQAAANPVLVQTGRLVGDGRIGTVLSATVRASRASKEPVPAASAYTLDIRSGAGTLEILGGHALSALFTALGSPPAAPERVTGTARLVRTQHLSADGGVVDATSPDVITGYIDLDPGIATISLTDGDLAPGTEITIVGSAGRVTLRTIADGELRLRQPQMADWSAEVRTPDGVETLVAPSDGLPLAARNPSHLYQAIRDDIVSGTTRAARANDAIAIHQILDEFSGN